MLAEIFLGWAVESVLEKVTRTVFSDDDQQQVLRRALEGLSSRLPDLPEREPVVETVALLLGGRRADWAVAPASLRAGLERQLEPIAGSEFRHDREKVTGQELLHRLGIELPRLAELAEQALVKAVREVAAERGGLPERVRQQDVAEQNELLAQLRDEVARSGQDRTMPAGSALRRGVADLIEEKTEAFVGRDYVFDAIDAFLGFADRGYFIVEGDPGSGKTSIVAEYVRRTRCVAHFNVRSQGISSVGQFAAGLADQLIARFGISRPLDVPGPDHYGPIINQLLAEAGEALAPGERLVIAVDALDEAAESGDGAANVLLLPRNPPKGVYFLLSRRRNSAPLEVHAPFQLYDLHAHHAETMRDIRAYLTLAAATPHLRAWLEERTLAPGAFIEAMTAKSEANFMYLRHVLPELARGYFRGLDLAELPQGLESYYETHWRLMGMTADPLPRAKLWVVYVVCEIARPVSPQLVAEVLRPMEPSVDVLAVQDVFDDWLQFLHRHDGPKFSLYHTSFRDFLHRRDIVASAGLSLPGVNDVIANLLWKYEFG